MVPPTNEEEDDANDDEVLTYDNKHGLKLFTPWYVDPHNVGENRGFLEILTQVNAHSMQKFAKKQYTTLRVDVSIYKMTFEVSMFPLTPSL